MRGVGKGYGVVRDRSAGWESVGWGTGWGGKG